MGPDELENAGSGFTLEHFDLLATRGGTAFSRTPEHVAARERLREAHRATKAWAEELQIRLFPAGRTEGRQAVINQGQHFSRYTWWRIYPRRTAPRELAYTVGIDQSGEFIVKLDTYQPTGAARAAYLAERGPTNDGSPFAEVMSAEEGVALSLDQLVSWSIDAIAGFQPGYDQLAARLGLGAPLTLVTDGDAVRAAIGRWRDAVLKGAIASRGVHWVPEGPFVARLGRTSDGRLQTELGHDPAGSRWLVRVNEARVPGSPNGLSAIGVDATGCAYLLRQGLLRGDGRGEAGVSPDEFMSRTGLKPVDVIPSKTGIDRNWFLVAAVDEGRELLHSMTASFVRACATARSPAAPPAPPGDAGYRLGSDEKGGTYVVGASGPRDERVVSRRQGVVWLRLQERLSTKGVSLDKPGHPLGYEVDAAFTAPNGSPVLIEIKTGTGSADIHMGVGQLHLYPALLPALGKHRRVLLLPGRPHQDLVASIEGLGIMVAIYDAGDDPDGADLRFSPEFLALCGVP